MSNDFRADVHRRITEQIATAIDKGAGEWRMPWHSTSDKPLSRPVNAETGEPYHGVNVVALWAEANQKGFDSRTWGTYRQWSALGGEIRSAERPSTVVFWLFDQVRENSRSVRKCVLARGYHVFNGDQVTGHRSPTPPNDPPRVRPIARAERFFDATGSMIFNFGDEACYVTDGDYIQMPPLEAFPDAATYYSTLAHEIIHWTGAEDRLSRRTSVRFGDDAYALEELTAELGAAFLCADLELSNTPRPDHAQYAAIWTKALQNDPQSIFTAAARAQKAVEYLHGLQPSLPLSFQRPSHGLSR